jgi:hypothetical protein
MFAVVEGHGFRIDERFQGVGRVGERRECKRTRRRGRSLRAGGRREQAGGEGSGEEGLEEGAAVHGSMFKGLRFSEKLFIFEDGRWKIGDG